MAKNVELSQLRHTCHKYFDTLWLYKFYYGGKKVKHWRRRQYKWLSRKMNLSMDTCHVSQFDLRQCRKAINICTNEFASNDNLVNFADKLENKEVFPWFNLY